MASENGEALKKNAVAEQLTRYLIVLKEKFETYLRVLDEERNDVAVDDIDKLARHAELERTIMKQIGAVQKVVDPLEELYLEAFPQGNPVVEPLRDTVDELRLATALRIESNQELLIKEMAVLKNSMESAKRNRRSLSLFERQPDPAYIDIKS